jgi:hypothetical protein
MLLDDLYEGEGKYLIYYLLEGTTNVLGMLIARHGSIQAFSSTSTATLSTSTPSFYPQKKPEGPFFQHARKCRVIFIQQKLF